MLGVYFFSSAINEEEALEEAKWVAEFIAPYKITYPVAYNCEGFSDPDNRQFNLTKEERSNLAVVFLDYIKEKGYVPMFYASQNELDNSSEWDTDSLTKKYKIWVAQYPDYMVHGSKSSYLGAHDMWQYTNNGRVPHNRFGRFEHCIFCYTKLRMPKTIHQLKRFLQTRFLSLSKK